MNQLKSKEFSRIAFQKFDRDRSGYLDRNELTQCLNLMAEHMHSKKPTDQEIDVVMRYVDKNKDQKVSQEEFQRLGEMLFKLLLKEK